MWEFTFRLEHNPEETLFIQIANSIAEDIKRGRLRPGERLPGSRTLARTAGVNRVTVVAAYDELTAQGWLTTRRARGTFVARELPSEPALSPTAAIETPTLAYHVPPGPEVNRWVNLSRAPGVVLVPGSNPDTRLLPHGILIRALHRVVRRSGGTLLGYANPEGHPRLRGAVAQMLRGTRGLAATSENILITRGSQMAIALVSRALLRPGDVVAVEAPGYRHAWDAFRQAGATLLPIPVDDDGLDVEALEAAISRRSISVVYVTPHHLLPTTVTLSAVRRARLLRLARARRFAIIEDDYDHDFHFVGPPVAALGSQDSGAVIYVGTFSKLLAPALRVGFLSAPPSVVSQLAAYRQAIDVQGDPSLEAALAELIEDGELQRYVHRAKRLYQQRLGTMAAALATRLGEVLSFTPPSGGAAIWARVAAHVDVETWAAASLQAGVAFPTGRVFAFDESPQPFVRLGFAALNEEEIREAVERMRSALSAALAH